MRAVQGIKHTNHFRIQSALGNLFQVGRCVEIGIPMLILFIAFSQYLKNFQTRQMPILERFSLLICITVIWAYAHLLTASGAYKHCSDVTQLHCRTDKANLISSAPFYEIQDHPLTLKIAAIRIKIPYPLQWGAPTFAADNTLDYKDSARDRGMPWWVKFWTFKGDSRNEEFYTLLFNLNRFFPPS
ncbi:hypothetical protein QYF36_022698 [Acer negundo]|nr:hypothetical protein QYF36_022698 [Acer negundo]